MASIRSRYLRTLRPLRWFSTAVQSSSEAKVVIFYDCLVSIEFGKKRQKSEKSFVPFTLFPKPIVTTPHFEISRLVTTKFAERYYKWKEEEYTRESLLQGAMQAATLCAEYITNNNWESLSHLCTNDLVEIIRDRCSFNDIGILRLSEDDLLCSFLHSALFSGRKVHRLDGVSAYFTAVVFFRTSPDVPHDLSPQTYLKRYLPKLLVCNITLTRPILPMGIWKVTTLNYFTP